jgi:two-component system, NtrC family, sensor histidine kinase PilS
MVNVFRQTPRRIRSYLVVRTFLVLLIALSMDVGLSFEIESSDQSFALRFASALAIVAAAGAWWQLNGDRGRRQIIYTQLMADSLMIGLIVFATGGADSLITFGFLLVIINGVNLGGREGAWLSAGASVVAFAVTVMLSGPEGTVLLQVPTSSGWRTLLTHATAFAAAAWLVTVLDREAVVARQALAILRNLHERVVENLPHGLLVVEADGLISVANPTGRSMIGGGVLVGRPFIEVLPAIGKLPTSGIRELRHRVTGETRDLRCTFTPLSSAMVVTIENVTELRLMQQKVILADRMASVGRLASGLAHELRNPLGNLTGAAQEMLKCEGDDLRAERHQLGDIVLQEGNRLNKLVEEFLTFARPRKPELVPGVLEGVVADVVAAFGQGRYGARNPVLFAPGGEHVVAMEHAQMHQLLHNLLSNAAEASPEGGDIEVSTARMASETGAVDQVVLSVADRGVGIPPEEQEKIFDPFYSRRLGGGGSGLGLAIVMRIVVDHGGYIEVESAPSDGTTFHLLFSIDRGA